MVITTGSHPKALWGQSAEQRPDTAPLTQVADAFVPKDKKPPKIKKKAFGASAPGAAFKK